MNTVRARVLSLRVKPWPDPKHAKSGRGRAAAGRQGVSLAEDQFSSSDEIYCHSEIFLIRIKQNYLVEYSQLYIYCTSVTTYQHTFKSSYN